MSNNFYLSSIQLKINIMYIQKKKKKKKKKKHINRAY